VNVSKQARYAGMMILWFVMADYGIIALVFSNIEPAPTYIIKKPAKMHPKSNNLEYRLDRSFHFITTPNTIMKPHNVRVSSLKLRCKNR